MKLKVFTLIIFCISIIYTSCESNKSSRKHTQTTNKPKSANKPITNIKFTAENDKTNFHIGEILKFNVAQTNDVPFDSIRFYANNVYLKTVKQLPVNLQLDKAVEKLGRLKVEAHIFADSTNIIRQKYFTFLSNIKPANYSYSVLKVYPHDMHAFTQGLVFNDGYLYEATGLKGESSLRKVQLATGDVLQAITIDNSIFGEGITIFNDKIIQLSWTSQIGFVYDKKSFKQLATFNYSTEGWGLTNDGKNLIMSDGSNKIYFLDNETYTEVARIEVYDDKQAVNNLNELEYMDGDIYANVYQTDKIAIIDAKTGKVKAYIDLKGILDPKFYTPETGVLNGIAYDFDQKRLFVTGKKWQKLFEIQIKK